MGEGWTLRKRGQRTGKGPGRQPGEGPGRRNQWASPSKEPSLLTGLCGQFPWWPLGALQLPSDNKIEPLVAQKVKNLPVMQETQVQSLGGKILWRKEWLLASVFLP